MLPIIHIIPYLPHSSRSQQPPLPSEVTDYTPVAFHFPEPLNLTSEVTVSPIRMKRLLREVPESTSVSYFLSTLPGNNTTNHWLQSPACDQHAHFRAKEPSRKLLVLVYPIIHHDAYRTT